MAIEVGPHKVGVEPYKADNSVTIYISAGVLLATADRDGMLEILSVTTEDAGFVS